jgi:hypothetical protein
MRGQFIDPVNVLKLFGGKAGYRKFVRDGLAGGHKEEYYEVEDQRFLGELCARCRKDGSPTVVDCCFPPLLTVGHFKDHSAEPLSAITGWWQRCLIFPVCQA